MLGMSVSDSVGVWVVLLEIMPIILLLFAAVLLYSCTLDITCWGILRHSVIMGTIFSYSLFAMNWIPKSIFTGLPTTVKDFGRNFAPRLVYCVGFGLLMLLALSKIYGSKERASKSPEGLFTTTMSMLSASSVLILLGTQGPFASSICVIGAWCILKLSRATWINRINTTGNFGGLVEPISVTQWSLLAVCLFFYTGHCFPALSCEFASVDVNDVLGTNRLNITKSIRKFSIDPNLKPIGPEFHAGPILGVQNHGDETEEKYGDGSLSLTTEKTFGILSDVLKFFGDNKKHMRECTLNTLDLRVLAVQLHKMVPYVTTVLADPKMGTEGCKDLFDWLAKHLSKINDSSEALHLLKPTASALSDKSAEV